MEKKKLIKVIKAVVPKNPSLVVLENILISDGFLEVSDLEVSISIPYDPEVKACCIPAAKFLTAMDIMEDPKIETDETGYSVKMSQGKKTIKLTGDHADNYPLLIPNDTEPMNHVGFFTDKEIGFIETALNFVSGDDLRPAMQGVCCGNDIAATDAHRLYWQPIEPMLDPFILPSKAAKLLLILGGNWNIYTNKSRAVLLNEEGVFITMRLCEDRYPDYPVVIPQGLGKAILTCELSDIRSEIKNAIKFANKCTSMVVLNLNGACTIKSQDVDFGFEYEGEIETAKIIKQEPLEIGFNGKFLEEILCLQERKQTVKIKMWEPHKAAIINDHFLIMPLMLNM